MKKLINSPERVVDEMLDGIAAAYPQYVKRLEGTSVLLRSHKKQQKVALVSGGGTGHEPAHAGYVGEGMLDAAVSGPVFTSPTPDQVYEAIKAADAGAGVLVVIKNYSGDVMNFEMAMELAEADGINAAKVIVDDDVAVENSTYTVGRRGIAGTVYVHKVAGAAAEAGKDLAEVQQLAEKVVANVRTMGMALTPAIVPAAGKANFTLGEDEVEIGMGIHGEPGIRREKLRSADEIAEELLGHILKDMPLERGDEVALMVNGLGGTPLMELFILCRRVKELLDAKGIAVYHTDVGNYMTAIEMAGASVTLLRLDDEMKGYLNARADTAAYRQL